MARAVHSIASLHTDLNRDERDLLLRCYEAIVANTLQSIKLLKSMELETSSTSHLKVVKEYTEITENLLEQICSHAIEVTNKHLLPFCVRSETKGIYRKMYVTVLAFYICSKSYFMLTFLSFFFSF
jgi:hypothetical protein